MWTIKYSKQAVKDSKKIEQSNLKQSVENLLEVLKENPFQNPPPYEKLIGDLTGKYSRRINIQHRLVYEVFEERKIVRVLRMWTHYE
ncbi:MAG: Txe/YoeB family addiction module toxin [Treponema sp.]|nr:Txe/YoeB family addiction module toxin [Treponema sp.]MDY3756635.1 Txe/YoeB family addiction module toxin [Treponema sp.]MDY4675250.1 Txe/YoeB family addiction module toxin [Treponema sp.]